MEQELSSNQSYSFITRGANQELMALTALRALCESSHGLLLVDWYEQLTQRDNNCTQCTSELPVDPIR